MSKRVDVTITSGRTGGDAARRRSAALLLGTSFGVLLSVWATVSPIDAGFPAAILEQPATEVATRLDGASRGEIAVHAIVNPFASEIVDPFASEIVNPFASEIVEPFAGEIVSAFAGEIVNPFAGEIVNPFANADDAAHAG